MPDARLQRTREAYPEKQPRDWLDSLVLDGRSIVSPESVRLKRESMNFIEQWSDPERSKKPYAPQA